jgi:hypothetical protein
MGIIHTQKTNCIFIYIMGIMHTQKTNCIFSQSSGNLKAIAIWIAILCYINTN